MTWATIGNGLHVRVGTRRREGRLRMTNAVTRVRCWTGPCTVAQIAQALRTAGFQNVLEGTEHVYVDLPGSGADFFGILFDAKRKVPDHRWLFDPRNCRVVRGAEQ